MVQSSRLYDYDLDQSDLTKWEDWNERQVAPYLSLSPDEVLQFAPVAHAIAMATAAASESVDRAFLGVMT